ncbi:MAG: RNA polymerase sigma factor [Candidatus Liptonbacteria bacterium]|nr:RNA polymerase sigma factor [Candidatus Liptonbacteria bacterium]
MYLETEKPLKEMPDEDILKKSVRNPALFSLLIDKYQLPFTRKALGIVHSQEEAEDITQEAFTKIYLNAKKFKKQPGVEFKSWAWRILVNTALTHYRKVKKGFGDVSYLDELLVGDDEDIESKLNIATENLIDKNDRVGVIKDAMEALPVEAASLLKAHYIEDRPYEEIAKKHGLSIGALKMKLFRARKVLKDIVGEEI